MDKLIFNKIKAYDTEHDLDMWMLAYTYLVTKQIFKKIIIKN